MWYKNCLFLLDSLSIIKLQSKVQTSVLGLGVDFVFRLSQQEQEQEQQEQEKEPPPKSIRSGCTGSLKFDIKTI